MSEWSNLVPEEGLANETPPDTSVKGDDGYDSEPCNNNDDDDKYGYGRM